MGFVELIGSKRQPESETDTKPEGSFVDEARREQIRALKEEAASLRRSNTLYWVQMRHGEAERKDHEATLMRVREIIQEIAKLREAKTSKLIGSHERIRE